MMEAYETYLIASLNYRGGFESVSKLCQGVIVAEKVYIIGGVPYTKCNIYHLSVYGGVEEWVCG